jgi:hypothetical protein
MELNSVIIDFHDDPKAGVLRSEGNIPDFVKEADLSTSRDDYNDFALVIINKDGTLMEKFAVDNAAMAWISGKYIEKCGHKLPKTAREKATQFIKTALHKFGLAEYEKTASVRYHNNFYDMSHFAKEMVGDSIEEQEKVASQDGPWGLSYINSKGEEINKYPLRNEEEIKLAMAWFRHNYRTMTPVDRGELASNISKIASEHDIEVSDDLLLKYASQDWKSGEAIKMAIDLRKSHVADEEQIKFLNIFEKRASEMSPVKAVETLQEFDKLAHIDSLWDAYIPDPHVSLLGNISDEGDIIKVGEEQVSTTQLEAIPQEKIAQYFGSNFAKEFKKEARAIFESLPTTEKALVINMAKGAI